MEGFDGTGSSPLCRPPCSSPPALRAADALPADRKAQVDALFAAYDRSDAPGCALGIFQDGRIAYARGYGMANLELGVANSPQTVFDIGSLGKQFTAFSILLLARDGKLSLDDDIRKFLPEIPDFGPRVTIRHLLHHTGGLRDYIGLLGLEGLGDDDVTTEQEALDALARQKSPLFAPGERYEYSNSGYFLLGLIVKRASGKSLREFAQRADLRAARDDAHAVQRRPHARHPEPRDGLRRRGRTAASRIEMSDFEQNGDGGVLTTVEDLFLLGPQLRRSARRRPRDLLDEMEKTGRLERRQGDRLRRGAADRQRTAACARSATRAPGPATARSSTASRTRSSPSPASATARASIRHAASCSRSPTSISAIVMQKRPAAGAKKPRVALPAAELARFAGAYRDPKTGDVWFVRRLRTELLAETARDAKARARADRARLDSCRRKGRASESASSRAPSGGPAELVATLERTRSTSASSRSTPGRRPRQLAGFAGPYTSDEVPAALPVRRRRTGNSSSRHRTIPPTPWTPDAPGFVRAAVPTTSPSRATPPGRWTDSGSHRRS